jgi:hypothetical protein
LAQRAQDANRAAKVSATTGIAGCSLIEAQKRRGAARRHMHRRSPITTARTRPFYHGRSGLDERMACSGSWPNRRAVSD